MQGCPPAASAVPFPALGSPRSGRAAVLGGEADADQGTPAWPGLAWPAATTVRGLPRLLDPDAFPRLARCLRLIRGGPNGLYGGTGLQSP